MKITYEDKLGTQPKDVHTEEVWDEDLNEIKAAVNDNDDRIVIIEDELTTETSDTTTLYFDKFGGYVHGDYDNPVTGDLSLVNENALEGVTDSVIWYGTEKPRISNGLVSSLQGEIILDKINIILISHIAGRFNINIIKFTPSPEIIILGNNPETVGLDDVYVDAGATATDALDNDITSEIVTTSDVDTSIEGEYHVNYSVTDDLNNTTDSQRVVNVMLIPAATVPTITVTE